MKRNVFVNLILAFCLLLLCSCVNVLEPQEEKDFTISLGEESARLITGDMVQNHKITDDTELKVICKIVGKSNKSQEKKVLLKDLSKVTFNFDLIPFNNDYVANIEFYWGNILLYKGDSNKFNLTQEESNVNIILTLSPVFGKIEYEFNGGFFEEENVFESDYFINSTYLLPEPKRAGAKFIGWYVNPDFSGEQIKELGGNNYFGNVKVYANWEVVSEISDVKSITGDRQVTLSWISPIDENIKETLITCNDPKVPSQRIPAGTNTATFTNLENRKKYTFNLQAVDIVNGLSKGVTKETFAIGPGELNPLTETYKELPAGTDGTFGTAGTYAFFGDYPQSLKAPEVLVSDNTVKVNGFDCYYGDDGAYYVKKTAILCNHTGHNSSPENAYKFDNNELIEIGTEYYFKVEPIKWRVLDENYVDAGNIISTNQIKGKLLLAENSLDAMLFYPNHTEERTINGKMVYSNNYEYSSIRAYLNGYNHAEYHSEDYTNRGFINKAFSESAVGLISTVTLDNTLESSNNCAGCSQGTDPAYYWKEHPYACNSTSDKIFILSQEEATNKEYFGDKEFFNNTASRYRKTTEYSRASGALSYIPNPANPSEIVELNNSDWWLRSPHWNALRARYVGTHGRVNRGYDNEFPYCSIVPAIVIDGVTSPDSKVPEKLKGFKYSTESEKITLSWDKPIDRDVVKIEIVCKEDSSKNVTLTRNDTSIVISGLTNGKKYSFTANCFDFGNQKSADAAIEVSLYERTEAVKNLPVGTEGSIGAASSEGVYVEFGDYPQTYVKDAPVGTSFVTVGGMDYYYGTDGHYYVKATATYYQNDYNGLDPTEFYKFDNNEVINKGSTYYFRVDPIKWRVVDNNYKGTNGKMLLAEKALTNSAFYPYGTENIRTVNGETVYANNYEHSKVRAFLNGLSEYSNKGFINQAFNTSAKNLITEINVDNSASSTNPEASLFISNNTNDKVFLLSYAEITNSAYGFGAYGEKDTHRARTSSDYARALGTMVRANNYTWWLTRSPKEDVSSAEPGKIGLAIHRVSYENYGDRGDAKYNSYGVVPAIVVNSAAFVAP